MGAMFLRAGDADLALCGASESAFTAGRCQRLFHHEGPARQEAGRPSQADPAQASRPFSIDRAGFVMAEGAGMLVLATESAVRRLDLDAPGRAAGLCHELRRLPHGHAQ